MADKYRTTGSDGTVERFVDQGAGTGTQYWARMMALVADIDLDIEASDLATALIGATTDAPSTDAETGTARSVTSLLKGIKNYARTLAAWATATVAPTATLTGWLNTLPWAVFHATPTTRTEAQGGPLEADANGNLKVVSAAGTALIGKVGIDQATANANEVVLKAGTALAGKVGIDQATANANEVVVKAAAYAAKVSITRPADTTPYTANDVVGAAAAALTFAVGPSAGGEVLITSAALEVDVTAIPSGMTSFNLHLYSVTPPSALADNAAFDLPSGDRASYLGFINLGSPADLGSTLYIQTEGVNKQVTLASGNLFGYLVTVGAYTPSSAAVKSVTLHSVRL